MEKEIKKTNKIPKLFIPILIFCIATIIIVTTITLLKPKNNDKKDNDKENEFIDVEIEIGTKTSISKLVNKKVKDDKEINTQELSKETIEIEYYEENNKNELTLKYRVVDKTPPVFMLNDTLTIQKEENKDVASVIFCADNYDKKPNCKIEGEYNSNEVGEYKLKFVAIDSNNNKSEKDFTLKVVEKIQPSNTSTDFNEMLNIHKKDNTEIGIDVSKWQGNINWNKVKNAGATFVMIRLGYQAGYNGESKLDPYFKQNIKGALSVGLKVGVYYFSYATTKEEAKEQANWIKNELNGYKIELPVVFDWENWSTFKTTNLNIMEINNVAYEFLKTVEENGYQPMLYGSKNYLEKVWHDDNKIWSNPGKTWLAHYVDKTTYSKEYYMWQLCSDGKIDGINGNVDIDIMYN